MKDLLAQWNKISLVPETAFFYFFLEQSHYNYRYVWQDNIGMYVLYTRVILNIGYFACELAPSITETMQQVLFVYFNIKSLELSPNHIWWISFVV